MANLFGKLKNMIFEAEGDEDEGFFDEEEAEYPQEEVRQREYPQREYERQSQSEYSTQQREQTQRTRDNREAYQANRGKVIPMSEKPNLTAMPGSGAGMKMILFQPLVYDDAQAIVDNLKAKKPVIVNMVDLERSVAQRVLDFMSGAVYALNGTVRRVAYGIFVIVPNNVSIVGSGEAEERSMFSD